MIVVRILVYVHNQNRMCFVIHAKDKVGGTQMSSPFSPSKGRKTFSLSALYISLNRSVSY